MWGYRTTAIVQHNRPLYGTPKNVTLYLASNSAWARSCSSCSADSALASFPPEIISSLSPMHLKCFSSSWIRIPLETQNVILFEIVFSSNNVFSAISVRLSRSQFSNKAIIEADKGSDIVIQRQSKTHERKKLGAIIIRAIIIDNYKMLK